MKLLFILAVLASCGKQEIELQDSKHTVSGETRSIVVLELSFITQVNELCKDLNPRELFESDTLHKKEIAQCTFDNISILNIEGLNPEGFENVLDDICESSEYQNETICQ